ALLSANAARYRGADAPAFVLFQMAPLDGRWPASEDGDALVELLRAYRPVLREKGFLLLRRTASPASEVERPLVQEGEARLGGGGGGGGGAGGGGPGAPAGGRGGGAG